MNCTFPQRDYCYYFQPGLSHPEWTNFGEQVATLSVQVRGGCLDRQPLVRRDLGVPPILVRSVP
jgi:hypothetical protein